MKTTTVTAAPRGILGGAASLDMLEEAIFRQTMEQFEFNPNSLTLIDVADLSRPVAPEPPVIRLAAQPLEVLRQPSRSRAKLPMSRKRFRLSRRGVGMTVVIAIVLGVLGMLGLFGGQTTSAPAAGPHPSVGVVAPVIAPLAPGTPVPAHSATPNSQPARQLTSVGAPIGIPGHVSHAVATATPAVSASSDPAPAGNGSPAPASNASTNPNPGPDPVNSGTAPGQPGPVNVQSGPVDGTPVNPVDPAPPVNHTSSGPVVNNDPTPPVASGPSKSNPVVVDQANSGTDPTKALTDGGHGPVGDLTTGKVTPENNGSGLDNIPTTIND